VYLIDEGTVVRIADDGNLVDAITGAGELLAMKRRVFEAPQDTTMPNGRFAMVFETNYATDVEVLP
jgi:hypothetical protein